MLSGDEVAQRTRSESKHPYFSYELQVLGMSAANRGAKRFAKSAICNLTSAIFYRTFALG